MTLTRDSEASTGGSQPPSSIVARRGRRSGRWAIRLASVGLAGLLLWLIGGFIAFSRSIATLEPPSIGQADGIVVLTGGSQRLSDALGLLASGHGKRLLISGVYKKTGREELAREASSGRSLLDCCVDLGKSARNTIGNAIETRRWARSNGFTSLLVVTSNYHMPRTLSEFGHALQGVRLIGYPVVSDSVDVGRMWTDPDAFRLVASEYAKFVLASTRQMFESDPEHSRLPVLIGRQKPLGPWPIEKAGPS